MEKGFKFDLGQVVCISVSGETGRVTGRAEYLDDANRYDVEYKAIDGRATEKWWTESSLEVV